MCKYMRTRNKWKRRSEMKMLEYCCFVLKMSESVVEYVYKVAKSPTSMFYLNRSLFLVPLFHPQDNQHKTDSHQCFVALSASALPRLSAAQNLSVAPANVPIKRREVHGKKGQPFPFDTAARRPFILSLIIFLYHFPVAGWCPALGAFECPFEGPFL